MPLNVDSYLRKIQEKTDGEEVIDNIIGAANLLNNEGLVDIDTEKTVIETHPAGNVIRKAIARLLQKFSVYESNKRLEILSQDEYDALVDKNPDVLYLIRREDRIIAVGLDDNYNFDPRCGSTTFPRLDIWDSLKWFLDKEDWERCDQVGLYAGKSNYEYVHTEIIPEQFKDTILGTAVFDLESYTIGSKAFAGCDRLRRIKLGSGISTIAEDAFLGCHDIHITIDKPEDSVLGAPWGARRCYITWTG